jgi:periplasmic protein TonB
LDFERDHPAQTRPGAARLGLSASLGLHVAVLVVALFSIGGAEPDDAPAEQAISIAVVQVTSVSTDASSIAITDATQTLQSAGAEAATPVESEAIEADNADSVTEAVEPEVVEALPAEAMPVDVAAAVPLTAPDAVEAVTPQPIAATEPKKPAETRPPVAKPAPEKPAAQAGNGGQNDADAVAGKPVAGQQDNAGTGGDAEVARYPGQVLKKLKRALRYPKGAGGAAGEVQVSFTVAANGQPSGIRIAQSSGNAAIDAAGIATVERAAPFPPIPAGANRKSWAFTVPLAFVR